MTVSTDKHREDHGSSQMTVVMESEVNAEVQIMVKATLPGKTSANDRFFDMVILVLST